MTSVIIFLSSALCSSLSFSSGISCSLLSCRFLCRSLFCCCFLCRSLFCRSLFCCCLFCCCLFSGKSCRLLFRSLDNYLTGKIIVYTFYLLLFSQLHYEELELVRFEYCHVGLFTALVLKDLKDVLTLDTKILGKLVNAVIGWGRCHIFLLPCLTSRHRLRLLSCREWNCIYIFI